MICPVPCRGGVCARWPWQVGQRSPFILPMAPVLPSTLPPPLSTRRLSGRLDFLANLTPLSTPHESRGKDDADRPGASTGAGKRRVFGLASVQQGVWGVLHPKHCGLWGWEQVIVCLTMALLHFANVTSVNVTKQ